MKIMDWLLKWNKSSILAKESTLSTEKISKDNKVKTKASDTNSSESYAQIPIKLLEFDKKLTTKTGYFNNNEEVKINAGTYPLYLVEYETPSNTWESTKLKLGLVGSIFFEKYFDSEGTIFIKKDCPERLSLESREETNILMEFESKIGQKNRFILFAGALPHPEFLINILNHFSQLDINNIVKFCRI